ncbi:MULTISPECIES: hypothetical protein [Acinetobacter]|uniref:hypothetical protein n=1 Tax=Acinetobacter TaxID=469 RepID=UPI00124D21A8|nr:MULTISPECIES: hypothetical protein [Acinetobacter]MCG2574188.1 hypothetical protein [Acinetobacter sp. ME22]
MEKLIMKGGFRERANRQRKYQNSENQQTTLQPHRYSTQGTTITSQPSVEIPTEHKKSEQ